MRNFGIFHPQMMDGISVLMNRKGIEVKGEVLSDGYESATWTMSLELGWRLVW
jgi:hypothetical protein